MTWSPGFRRLTPDPTESTTPATSHPDAAMAWGAEASDAHEAGPGLQRVQVRSI